jgi:outer membrane protein TolC
MNSISKYRTIVLFSFLAILFPGRLICQPEATALNEGTSDSLSLQAIIAGIITNHPTIKSAEEALNNADARIGLARTGYYPQVDLNSNYANQGPVIKLKIPDMGTFSLFPENNYSATINYKQVIYDFGRTRQNIGIENESRIIGEQALEQVKQKMSLAAVNSFYTLAFLQRAVKIKDEELDALRNHLKFIETLKSTGSATDYQVLSTKVKISSVESQKVDLLAAISIQQSYLNCLAGFDDRNRPVVREELNIREPAVANDSLLSFAFSNRDEILMNKEKADLAGMKYDLIKLMNKPVISFVASGGAKNGYIPDLNRLRPNYVVGAGITIPIFDGFRTKYNLLQARSALNTIEYETENAKKNITTEVREAHEYMKSAKQKIVQSELQLEQALKACSLAETSFGSGVITNLELLDANTAVSESRLMLLKARIDHTASIYRLKAALGERIYQP